MSVQIAQESPTGWKEAFDLGYRLRTRYVCCFLTLIMEILYFPACLSWDLSLVMKLANGC